MISIFDDPIQIMPCLTSFLIIIKTCCLSMVRFVSITVLLNEGLSIWNFGFRKKYLKKHISKSGHLPLLIPSYTFCHISVLFQDDKYAYDYICAGAQLSVSAGPVTCHVIICLFRDLESILHIFRALHYYHYVTGQVACRKSADQ